MSLRIEGAAQNAAPSNSVCALASGYEVDRLLNGRDLLGFFVRNFSFEFLFKCHNQFNRVQRIGSKIINKGSIVRYLVLFHAELLCNDALNLFLDTAHSGRFS